MAKIADLKDLMIEPSGDGVTRRRFLSWFVAGVAGIVSAVLAVPLIGYFFSPLRTRAVPVAVPIARINDIPLGTPTFVRYEERVPDAWIITTQSKGAWVWTEDGSRFIVYDPHCTHLNCPYYWDTRSQRFLCPCHGGVFSINGEVLAGPPPRPLDRMENSVQGDEIVVTGTIIRGETSVPWNRAG